MLNPYTWEQRVQHILDHDNTTPLFELEPVTISIGIITLVTDEKGRVHIFANYRLAVMGGIDPDFQIDYIRNRIEEVDRTLRKKHKIVKVEAFVPFWLLKNLYLPAGWKPYKKSRKKRII